MEGLTAKLAGTDWRALVRQVGHTRIACRRRGAQDAVRCSAGRQPRRPDRLKLQALANDPRRTQDLAEICALIRANRATLNMAEVREFFRCSNARPCLRSFSVTPNSSDGPLLADDAGVPTDTRHPFAALEDLMAVVDALCPRWPARSTTAGPGSYTL